MKKNKRFKVSTLLTVLLAIVAVCLLVVGGIGGARAVLIPDATEYDETLQASVLDVTLLENGVEPEKGLLSAYQETPFALGKHYKEELRVQNPEGNLDSYVRVTLYKYWTDKNGKRVDLDPSLIEFEIPEPKDPDKPEWIEKTPDSFSPECRVFYYTKKLSANAQTDPVINAIFAKQELGNYVTQTIEQETSADGKTKTTITSKYQYDGLTLNLKASVDAIQASHVEEAMKSSWDVDVTMNGETIASIN